MLGEIALRVLAELEELGEENIFGMINTVTDRSGDWSEVLDFKRALQELVDADLITMGTEAFVPRNLEELTKSESCNLVERLEDWFRYDASARLWSLRLGDFRKERKPVILVSDSGLATGTAILSERGYQWWRPEN